MQLKKLLYKFYFTFFKKFTIKTVHLRGRISDQDKDFLKSVKDKFIFTKKDINKIIAKYKNYEFEKVLEIGFGNGSHICFLESQKKFLVFGAELYEAGIVNTARSLEMQKAENIFLFQEDARILLDHFPDYYFQKVFVLFPDPWPKKRHNKRRFLQKEIIKVILSKVSLNRNLIIATDWRDYAIEIENNLEILTKSLNIEFDKKVYSESFFNLEKDKNKQILETTFAKRAIKEKREIAIFEIQKV